MNHSQITGILIIFGLAYFISWVNIYRSHSDQELLQSQVLVERGLRIEIDKLKDEIRAGERLYDIQTGRLLEMTLLAKEEIEDALGDFYYEIEKTGEFVDRLINRERRK